jgi:hypothetical protein
MDWRIQSIILTLVLAFAIAIVATNIAWAVVVVHVAGS